MKKSTKILSFVLSVIMLFSVFSASTPVFAADVNEYVADREYTEKVLTEVAESDGEEKAPIVKEVKEKRDEFKKVYLREDGSYTAVVSQTPIHTLTDGEWTEIDNTLQSEEGVLKNADGCFDIEFPETISSNEKITVTNNGESIAFSVNDIDNSSAVVTTSEAENADVIEDDLSKAVSEITYEAIDENTNIQYVVSSDFVKENIIVNDKESVKNTYSFDIEKGNLTAVLDDGNALVFKNEKNEIVFTIPAPVMTDADNAVSYDIDVAVENIDKSVLTLTYTPSRDWLQSAGRKYPVVIDPVIVLPSENESIIEDTVVQYTSEDLTSKDTNYINAPIGLIADAESGETNEFTKSNVLVKLNMDAFDGFNSPEIAVTDVNYVATGNVMGGNILAKPINGVWDCSTITYDDVYPTDGTTPLITYEDTVMDYFTGVPANTQSETVSTVYLNITEYFNGWLKNKSTNNGFAIVPENSDVSGMLIMGGFLQPTSSSKTVYYDSYCTIDYVDTTGTNDSFEYLTQEIGRAGTVSVNIFTRSLSLNRWDLSMDGLRLSTGVGFNFNPALAAYTDISLSIVNEMYEDNETANFPYGNNWLPSHLQLIAAIAQGEYQFFTGEGTLVTFEQKEETVTETVDGVETSSTVITFEESETSDSGYTLELIDTDGDVEIENMKVTSPGGETSYFNDYGFVNRICEAEPNEDGTYDEINIVSEDEMGLVIDYITDGIGRKYDFEYDENSGLLTKINCLTADGTQIKAGTTDADLKVTYGYDESGNLTGVTYPDGKTVTYIYDTNGNLVKVTNIDGYSIEYTYDNSGKVTKITEKSGTEQGNFITLEDLENRQVKITDAYSGTEIQQFGKDGRLNYTFDEKGNYLKSDYAPAKDENVFSINGWKVAPENLLKNGSFDTASNNLPTYWDNAFTVDFADINNVFDNACKVQSTEEVTRMQGQTVNVDGGKDFTFSLYAKYNGEEIQTTDKLYLRITAVDEEENETSKSVQITPTNEFEQYSVSVSSSTETDYVTVEFGLKNKTGDFLVNNAQLEGGKGTAEFNYVENGTFGYVTENVPDNWSNATVILDNINGKTVKAVKLNGGLPAYEQSGGTYTLNDSVSAVTQNVKINGKKGDIYSLGGWFKGLFDDNYINPDFIPPNADTNTQLTNSAAQIKVSYTYEQVTTDENGNETTQTVTENFAVNFAPHNKGWQYAVDSFALKGDVESVDVTVITKNIPSASYATNISLTRDFDSEVIEDETSEGAGQEETTCVCGCKDCAYGENCPCTGAINNDCRCPECLRKETTTEDSFGNTLSNKSTDGIKYIETFSDYTTDGNYLASYTDERGNVISYDYNTLNGVLEAVTSPMGTGNDTTTTSYEYDEMGDVVSVSTALSDSVSQKLEYVYTNDRLTEIITPNGKFKIIYDAWGQVLSVNVVTTNGNLVPLVEYTYNTGALRTQVATATYHNSSTNSNTYQYTYSADGNVTNIKINNIDKHNISYSSLGDLTEIENEGGRTVTYTDNGVYITNDSGEIVYTSVTDSEGKITEENYGIKYGEHEQENSYNPETGLSTKKTALDVARYYRIEQAATTDWFGREDSHLTTVYDITEETEENSAETIGKISTEYEYPVASDGKTSSAIEKYVNKTYNGDSESVRVFDGYFYEYDKQNKISAEKTLNADGTTTDKYSYVYDKLGQLVRFNDAIENKSYTYTYDSNGNILTKSEYAYTTGNLGTATKTTTYGYDTQWKDKLTSVGNKTIDYDNIGNPINYLGAVLTWEGRELKSYETSEQKFEYMYDENGMRYRTTVTNKEDNSVGYLDYIWVDSKLISISFTSDELNQTVKYLYNDFDEPVGFVSTREDGSVDTYYYLKNAQGDITHIVSAAGKKMVSFTYDAWGKRKVEYQANGSTTPSHIELITQIKADLLNPFAYRGYCYDYDMGMYYLQSRYYDPEVGRFINADDTDYLNATGTVLGCNLFAYCENEPVNNVDPKGNVALLTCVLIGAGIGLMIGASSGVIISYSKYRTVKWKYVLVGGLFGIAIGALAGYGVGVAIGATTSTSIGLSSQASYLAKNVSKLKFSNTIKGYAKVRKYYNYTSVIKNIIQSATPVRDGTNALKWLVPGVMNGTQGIWELVINPSTKVIYHFLFNSKR
ncbi:MAG: RHS repeat domain-containing protein [Acutalibacteraceae bacterium]